METLEAKLVFSISYEEEQRLITVLERQVMWMGHGISETFMSALLFVTNFLVSPVIS